MTHYIVRFRHSSAISIDAETELEAVLGAIQYLVVEEEKHGKESN